MLKGMKSSLPRQANDEGCAKAGLAGDLHGSRVGVHDGFANGQTKPGVVRDPGAGFVRPVKSFENVRYVFRGDTHTGVGNNENC
jgi:hypothetical protein